MAVKIRLARHGKKGHPYFHIIVADARSPRDGKYIERLGFYNPNTNPATIEIDVDSAVKWLNNGAQPTDTARAILSYKGVLYKNHLLKGVKKGAFDEAEAERRFEAWLNEKQAKIDGKITGLADAKIKEAEDRLKAEEEKNKERLAAIAAANAPEVEETEEAEGEEATAEAAVEAPETAEAETPAPEAPAAEVEDAPAAEAETPAPEAPAAEVEDATQAPAEEETPATEAETPAPEAPVAEGEDATQAPAEEETKE